MNNGKRLVLRKETLTDLDTGQLTSVVGGTQSVALCTDGYSCSVCSIHCPTFGCPSNSCPSNSCPPTAGQVISIVTEFVQTII